MNDIFLFFYFYYLEFTDSLNSTYFVNDQKSNNLIFKEILLNITLIQLIIHIRLSTRLIYYIKINNC